MSEINDGGCAFPRPASIGNNYATGEAGVVVDPQTGMSLRDWFAGMALQGLLSFSPPQCETQLRAKEASKDAYRLADAMLEARQENP